MIPPEYIIETPWKWTCLYCGVPCRLVDASLVYHGSSRFGMVWLCSNYPECDARVGARRDHTPLGHPARKDLRELRIKCHNSFDPLWKKHITSSSTKKQRFKARNTLYKELAGYMNLTMDLCHFAMFNEEQCRKALQFINQKRKENE